MPPAAGVGVVTVAKNADIAFENVDLVSPDGKLLVKSLTFTVKRGTNVMVTGPNGSGMFGVCFSKSHFLQLFTGKSSLFRGLFDFKRFDFFLFSHSTVIGGLWPLHCGHVTRPPQRDVLFVPQKPYLVIGTLRDQLIYPHTPEQMRARGAFFFWSFPIFQMVDLFSQA